MTAVLQRHPAPCLAALLILALCSLPAAGVYVALATAETAGEAYLALVPMLGAFVFLTVFVAAAAASYRDEQPGRRPAVITLADQSNCHADEPEASPSLLSAALNSAPSLAFGRWLFPRGQAAFAAVRAAKAWWDREGEDAAHACACWFVCLCCTAAVCCAAWLVYCLACAHPLACLYALAAALVAVLTSLSPAGVAARAAFARERRLAGERPPVATEMPAAAPSQEDADADDALDLSDLDQLDANGRLVACALSAQQLADVDRAVELAVLAARSSAATAQCRPARTPRRLPTDLRRRWRGLPFARRGVL